MKLNNKGFAISSVMYSLLILAVSLMFGILAILVSRKMTLDKIKEKTKKTVNGDIIIVPEKYKGITPKSYNVGDSVSYADLNWIVVKDNGNNVTVVLDGKINASGHAYATYKTDLDNFISKNATLAIAKKNNYILPMNVSGSNVYVKTLSLSDIYSVNPIPTSLTVDDAILPDCKYCSTNYDYYLLDAKDANNTYAVRYSSANRVNYLSTGNSAGYVRPIITIVEKN